MPELPEVETIRTSLEPLLVGRRIVATVLHRRDVLFLPGDSKGGQSRARPRRATDDALLRGRTITRLCRHGKQLALIADDGRALVFHLGMTGQLLSQVGQASDPPLSHTHITWQLDDASRLMFRDPRRFGGVWVIPDARSLERRWSALGPDALTIPSHELHRRAHKSRRAIKAVLLDQAVLAGVGNIYADESLFLARIRPRRRACTLTKALIDTLADAVHTTLAAAITARGSTLRDYRDARGIPGSAQHLHRVYGRAGHQCVTCGKTLTSDTTGQRTTVYCRWCQR